MLSVVPLSRPLDSFWTSFVLFDFIFSVWLQVLLVSFTPTYVFSYFWLKINSILSVSSCVTSYSFEMDIENKFYICSPCIASFWFLVYVFFFSFCFKRSFSPASSNVGEMPSPPPFFFLPSNVGMSIMWWFEDRSVSNSWRRLWYEARESAGFFFMLFFFFF